MAAFICRYCGAPLETAEISVCECRSCGRLQSIPLIDSAEKRELLLRAEQLRREQRYDKAIQLYEKMIAMSPVDADLYWALALCRYGVLFFADGGLTLQRTQAHSFISDSDYQQALIFADEKQRRLMEDIAALIDEKQRRISELSVGISYDVLLCSSTDEESVGYSMTLYNRMRSEGINVFYPDVTLKTTAKSEWEPYLFSAVNSAKALILTVTDPDILNDIMVMNLCGRFMSVDMSGRAVIPVLFGVTPGELPPELSKFQALNSANLGFEQDLVSRVKALSGVHFNEPSAEENPLVRRAYIMLSDSQFSEAESMCARIEPLFPTEAALIRLLCEYSVTTEEALGTLSADIMQSENYRLAMQYGNEALRLKLKKYALSAQENLHAADTQNNERKSTFPKLESADGVYSAKIKPVKKRSRLFLLAASLVIVSLTTTAVIVISHYANNSATGLLESEPVVSGKEAEFERAKALFDEGNYVEAEAAFISLDNYDESEKWVYKCRYMQAEKLLENNDAENARNIFLRLGDYKDSAEKVKLCDYKTAELVEENGEYEAAAEAFDSLGSFFDSKTRKKECMYKQAAGLLDRRELDSAEAIFKEIKSYSDSAEQLKKIDYQRAEALFDNGEYSSAYEKFSELDSWSDSYARAKDSLYQYAKKLFEDGDYYNAVSPLSKLGDYLDSRDMLNASWLARALEKIEGHDKRKAYDTLTFRVDEGYAPAQPYITSLRNEVLMSSDWGRDIYLGKYFNADPDVASHIEWLVIKREEGMALVVSESALEYLPFDTGGNSAWTNSSLRSWLNGEFYQSAFTDEEKALIVSAGNGGSEDKVFLLSCDEAATMFTRAVSPNKSTATIYTQLKIPKGNELYCWQKDGFFSESGTDSIPCSDPGLIFPAMWIKIER